MKSFDRCWLLTCTTYGTWLPGDERGFVSNFDGGDGIGVRLNEVGTEYSQKLRGLQIEASKNLKGPPIRLQPDHAKELLDQFIETANYRNWKLLSVAIMANHIHVLVGVPGDPEPHEMLRDFKSYGSRRLNRTAGKPVNGTWWTEGGSVRKKADDQAVYASIEYLMNQEFPLLTWRAGDVSPLFLNRFVPETGD
jgi:REP element-mobilizing transposase RayT